MKHKHLLSQKGAKFKCIHPQCTTVLSRERAIDIWLACPKCGKEFISSRRLLLAKLVLCPDCRPFSEKTREAEWLPTLAILKATKLQETIAIQNEENFHFRKELARLEAQEKARLEFKALREEKKAEEKALGEAVTHALIEVTMEMPEAPLEKKAEEAEL